MHKCIMVKVGENEKHVKYVKHVKFWRMKTGKIKFLGKGKNWENFRREIGRKPETGMKCIIASEGWTLLLSLVLSLKPQNTTTSLLYLKELHWLEIHERIECKAVTPT